MAGYPHMANLVIGVPFSGKSLPPQQALVYSNFSGQVPMNYNARYFHLTGQPIDKAREWFAERAIESNAKYLAMWDEDVVVPPYWLRQLIYLLEHHDDWGMVGGIYCQKNEPESTCAPMVFRGVGKGPFWKWRVGEIFEVDAIATGVCLIRVDAFKDVPKPWFNTVQDFEPYLDGIPKGTSWTEDLWWCDQLKKTGKWKIYADGSLVCGHMDLTTGKVYNLPADSYPMRRLMVGKGHKKILDIGCGDNKYRTNEGDVIGVDLREMEGVDYRCDITKMPFATGSYDIIHSAHVLEHFGRNEWEAVLDEWLRVLKPDGEVRLSVPNTEWAAKKIVSGVVDHDVMNVLWGQQEYGLNFHKTGFTPAMIREAFEKRGFEVDIKTPHYHIMVNARRKPIKKAKAK